MGELITLKDMAEKPTEKSTDEKPEKTIMDPCENKTELRGNWSVLVLSCDLRFGHGQNHRCKYKHAIIYWA